MYRAFGRGAFFFAVFSKILAKKFHFIVFFVVISLSHLMHSVGAIFIRMIQNVHLDYSVHEV